MPTVYDNLVNNSLSASLASIEMYNKPDFKYREEVFTILIINAWELLLKAKILKDAGDDLKKLYRIENGIIKLNRSGTPFTIDIFTAINMINLDVAIIENIKTLVDIRDTIIHFYQDQILSYVLYTLAVASLTNYQKLIGSWFSRSLLEYNFYILPLGFIYNFKTLSLLELEKSPEAIANLVKSVTTTQTATDGSNNFYFVCELSVEMKSAKRFSSVPDLSVAVDPTVKDPVVVHRIVNPIHKYPLTYADLCKKVKQVRPDVKQDAINAIIRNDGIKDNIKLSYYIYRSQAQEEIHKKTGVVPKGVPSLYNEDAVRHIIATLSPK